MAEPTSRGTNTLYKIVVRHPRMPAFFRSKRPVYLELARTEPGEESREVQISYFFQPAVIKPCSACGHIEATVETQKEEKTLPIVREVDCKNQANAAWKAAMQEREKLETLLHRHRDDSHEDISIRGKGSNSKTRSRETTQNRSSLEYHFDPELEMMEPLL